MNKILLFIPMYNCEKQIVRVLKQVNKEVLKYISQIIVVNNRSTDNGEQRVIEYCNKHPELPLTLIRNNDNYGLGGSHKVAFQYSIENNYDYVIVLHGDDQGGIKDLIPYLKSEEAFSYDSFLGSRFEKESTLINYSKIRVWGNYVFNTFMSISLGRKITDLGSGLNMYSVKYLKTFFYKPFINNLTFNVYMLIYGVYSQSKFDFFPLTWREDDQISNAKFLKQSIEILKITFSYLLNKKNFLEKLENKYSVIEYSYKLVYNQNGESDE